jgi:hypothetical protein
MAVLLGESKSTRRNGAEFFGTVLPAVRALFLAPPVSSSPSVPVATNTDAQSEIWTIESRIHLYQSMRDLEFTSLSEAKALYNGNLPIEEAENDASKMGCHCNSLWAHASRTSWLGYKWSSWCTAARPSGSRCSGNASRTPIGDDQDSDSRQQTSFSALQPL